MKYEHAKAKLEEITEKVTGCKDFIDFESKEGIEMMKVLTSNPKPVCQLLFKAYEHELTKRVQSEGKQNVNNNSRV